MCKFNSSHFFEHTHIAHVCIMQKNGTITIAEQEQGNITYNTDDCVCMYEYVYICICILHIETK